jgi:hypothetical protein
LKCSKCPGGEACFKCDKSSTGAAATATDRVCQECAYGLLINGECIEEGPCPPTYYKVNFENYS